MTTMIPEPGQVVPVGLGEMQVTSDAHAILACYGLGSCIGVSAYDAVAKVGGMAHIILPFSNDGTSDKAPAKFANLAIPCLIREMEKMGALRHRIVMKIAGGARIISSIESGSVWDVGERNVVAVTSAIAQEQIKIQAKDTGGTWGRSFWLFVESGVTRIRTATDEIIDL